MKRLFTRLGVITKFRHAAVTIRIAQRREAVANRSQISSDTPARSESRFPTSSIVGVENHNPQIQESEETMISDVLSDAVAEIEDYERELSDTYTEIAAEITVVKTVMDGLRIVFDAVPGQPAEYERLIAELRSEILAINLSGLVAARERLLAWVVEERQRLDDEERREQNAKESA